MAALMDADWLGTAQGLSIGAVVKVRHVCGRSPSLVIGNDPAHWWAYCHRCGGRARKDKTMVRLTDLGAPAKDGGWRLPDDRVAWCDMREHEQLYWMRNLAMKGLQPGTYCTDRLSSAGGRLVIQTNQGLLGRSFHPGAAVKVAPFRSEDGSIAHFASVSEGAVQPHVVLVEDVLSAMKVQHAVQQEAEAVALLGTSVRRHLVPWLIKRRVQAVTIMLDGDAAGYRAVPRVRAALRGLGFRCTNVHTPEGQDPRDMHIRDIREALNVCKN